MRILILTLLLICIPAQAAETVNRCHNEAAMVQWTKLLKAAPKDPVIIKLYALWTGLCGMVDNGLVELEAAMGVFDGEHAKDIMRKRRDMEKRRELAL